MEAKDKKVTSAKANEDFLDTTQVNQASILEMAKAIGEGMAKELVKQTPKESPKNAAVAVIAIEEQVRVANAEQAAYADFIKKDTGNYVDVMIPTIYKRYCPSMTVSLNGCTIKVPADGVTRKVHKDYATEINSRLRYYDKKIQAMNENNDIQEIQSL